MEPGDGGLSTNKKPLHPKIQGRAGVTVDELPGSIYDTTKAIEKQEGHLLSLALVHLAGWQ
jgi:hypothetical protein